MLVEELLEKLEGMDKDAEVRLAMQPNYPLEYTIDAAVWVVTDPDEGTTIVYLAEGEQVGYLPEQVTATLEEEGYKGG